MKTVEQCSQRILNNEKFQASLKKIQEISDPIISKYSAMINLQIDRTMKKFNINKEDFILLQKASQARMKFIEIGEKVLFDTENLVSKYCKDHPEVLIGESKLEINHVPDDFEGSLKPRIQCLVTKLNHIGKFWLGQLWVQVKNQKLDIQSIKKILDIVEAKINLWENLTNAKIIFEMGYEYINEQMVDPAVKSLKLHFKVSKDNVVLVVEGLKHKGLKEIIQEARKNCVGLEGTVVEFFKNKVVVIFKKENLIALGDKSKKALMDIVDTLKNKDLMAQKAQDLSKKGVTLYQNVLANLKKRNKDINEKYCLVVKAVQEKKLEKDREIHEDKSTDHKSESEEQHELHDLNEFK